MSFPLKRTSATQNFPFPHNQELVYETPPCLVWVPKQNAGKYTVTVKDEAGNEIFKGETKNNYIYGIALPNSEIQSAINLIHDNWALKHLKIRLYGAYRNDNDELTAIEYCPEDIYK